MSDEFPLTFICGPETNFTVYEVGYENLMNSWYCGQNFGSQESDNKNSKSVQRTSNDSDKFPAVLDCGSGDFAIFRNGSLVEDYSYAYECGKELQEALHSAAPAMLRRQGKTTLVAYIFAILILFPETEVNSTLSKRDQSGTVWKYQTAQSGTEWAELHTASDCDYCDNTPDDVDCGRTLDYSNTYEWSITAHSGIKFGIVDAGTDVTISRSWTKSDEFECHWYHGDGPAQIWFQQRRYWADLQKRECWWDALESGDVVMDCGAWSKYYHALAPVKNLFNKGCSEGYDNVNCERTV